MHTKMRYGICHLRKRWKHSRTIYVVVAILDISATGQCFKGCEKHIAGTQCHLVGI